MSQCEYCGSFVKISNHWLFKLLGIKDRCNNCGRSWEKLHLPHE